MITPGQAHDVTAFPALMQEIDCDPEQMLGDKGYDSEAVRNDIEERGGEAAIPSTATRKIQHAVDKALYALRNRIERFFNRAKNSRRVATRYDKLIESFAAFVLLQLVLRSRDVCRVRAVRARRFSRRGNGDASRKRWVRYCLRHDRRRGHVHGAGQEIAKEPSPVAAPFTRPAARQTASRGSFQPTSISRTQGRGRRPVALRSRPH